MRELPIAAAGLFHLDFPDTALAGFVDIVEHLDGRHHFSCTAYRAGDGGRTLVRLGENIYMILPRSPFSVPEKHRQDFAFATWGMWSESANLRERAAYRAIAKSAEKRLRDAKVILRLAPTDIHGLLRKGAAIMLRYKSRVFALEAQDTEIPWAAIWPEYYCLCRQTLPDSKRVETLRKHKSLLREMIDAIDEQNRRTANGRVERGKILILH